MQIISITDYSPHIIIPISLENNIKIALPSQIIIFYFIYLFIYYNQNMLTINKNKLKKNHYFIRRRECIITRDKGITMLVDAIKNQEDRQSASIVESLAVCVCRQGDMWLTAIFSLLKDLDSRAEMAGEESVGWTKRGARQIDKATCIPCVECVCFALIDHVDHHTYHVRPFFSSTNYNISFQFNNNRFASKKQTEF